MSCVGLWSLKSVSPPSYPKVEPNKAFQTISAVFKALQFVTLNGAVSKPYNSYTQWNSIKALQFVTLNGAVL